MNNELIIEKFGLGNQENEGKTVVNKLKKIGNDSLFYFAIFLSAFFLLQLIPFIGGVFKEFSIGINEVVVSIIGFANVFFLQVFNKVFRKVN